MKKLSASSLALFLCLTAALLFSCGQQYASVPSPGDGAFAPAETLPVASDAPEPDRESEGAAPEHDVGTDPGPEAVGGSNGDSGQGQATPAVTAMPSPAPQETQEAEDAPGGTNAPQKPTQTDDGPVFLTIRGDGVAGETTWTLGQLQALGDGYREYTYSTTNNWPVFGHMSAKGVSLPYLLRQAGLLNSAASLRLTATDGYNVTVTNADVHGALISFSSHSPEGSGSPTVVEPIVAWEWGETAARPENLRPFFGQRGPHDVNTSIFVKGLHLIEVSTTSAGAWAAPEASVKEGAPVPAGTELELMHSHMDSIRIYYTTDGSEPDYSSPVYNRSASYFQPQLIKPLVLVESVTIKAFAAGFGKDPSPVVTFSYTVE